VIRARAWALALPLVLIAACRSSGSDTPASTAPVAVPFATVIQIAVPGQTGKRLQVAVRDADAWKTLWSDLRKDSALAEDPPAVDFETEMVIVAAMETQGCVSRVTLRSIARTSDKAAVDILEEPPAANCRCFVSSRPIHVVKVQKMSGEITFTTSRGEMPCGS
jgi:hypothetical protein